MTLQTKFATLLALVVLTTAVILGVSLSFGAFLQRELSSTFGRTAGTLLGLLEVHDHALRLGSRAEEMSIPSDSGETGSPAEGARRALVALAADPAWRSRVGASAADALIGHVHTAADAHERWLRSWMESDLDTAERARANAIGLIGSIQRRLVAEGPLQIAYSTDLKRINQTLAYAGLLSAGLFMLLCLLLLRRWVLRPVRDLREAAARIGEGDFTHRVPVIASDEIGRLSAEVNRMAAMVATMQQQAVENERLASTGAMVRRLAHNIRNPLSAVRGLAELTKRRVADPTVRKDQDDIIDSVDRFNAWLGDLLSVTAPKEIMPVTTELVPWLKKVVDGHGALARMRGVTLTHDFSHAPASLRIDPRHLEHALVAVITNAIQASPADGEVSVDAGVAGEGGQSLEIKVRDRGPGVPPELVEKIFHPYFTTKRDGTGIGLAIARQVIQGHQGTISVENDPQGGAAFRIRIPLSGEMAEVGG